MKAAFAMAIAAVAAALVIAAACGSTPVITVGATFQSPSAVAVTWAEDRDLIFVANSAGDDMTAMTMCTQVKVADGGYQDNFGNPIPNTCTETEDQQLLPGPIRVFPGSITTGERPTRIAGMRLLGPPTDTNPNPAFGAVLVAGLDTSSDGGVRHEPVLRMIDANNILDLSRRKPGAVLRPPVDVALPSPPVDVVASETPGHHVRAFVVTQAPTGPAVLTSFDATTENGPVIVPSARCTLDLVATRLALVPGTDDLLPGEGGPAHVYVADGTPDGVPGGKGDGAVEVSVPAMPPYDAVTLPACPAVRRLPASDPSDPIRVPRPLRAIALAPAFFQSKAPDGTQNAPPPVPARGGSILLGVTLGSSALCGVPGNLNCGAGSIVIVQTGNPGGTTSRVAPAPPADFFTAPADAPAMAPLHPLAAARDITFLRPIPNCPAGANACVQITTGLTTRVTPLAIQLAAAASTDDGGTVMINVIDRRFVDDLRDSGDPNAALPPALTAPTFFPSQAANPVLAFPPPAGSVADPTKDPYLSRFPPPCPEIDTTACLNKGVTLAMRWQVTWRGIMPGLESVAGLLHRDSAASPTVRLDLAATDLTPWIKSPRLALQKGDVIHIHSIANPGSVCRFLGNFPTTQDILIDSVEPRALVLSVAGRQKNPPTVPPAPPPERDVNDVPAFELPTDCGPPSTIPPGSVAVAVDIRTGAPTPGGWLVTAGTDVRGRVGHNPNAPFLSKAQRYDYPLDKGPQQDTEIAFAPVGDFPTAAGQQFTFATARGTQATTIRETAAVPQGPVGDVIAYQSEHFSNRANNPPIISPNILFTAVTGNNALLRASPANIGAENSLVVYR
ncbi:MAG: hypothetical protein ACJ787_06705 [Myxococcales bacterium]